MKKEWHSGWSAAASSNINTHTHTYARTQTYAHAHTRMHVETQSHAHIHECRLRAHVTHTPDGLVSALTDPTAASARQSLSGGRAASPHTGCPASVRR